MTSASTVAVGLSAIAKGVSIHRVEAILMAEQALFSYADFLDFTLAFEPNAFNNKAAAFLNAVAHVEIGPFLTYLTKGRCATLMFLLMRRGPKMPWY